ncbi:hypothetical protein PYW07_000885 [Mythimna separata]|uniref:Uncharacterized protein n=1 Tax=Mythimna separata TaxID=271217 RepID=A0AAD7YS06_MYTSE|nr:hypothetical protein PYW07_000885 [Mythimna separata]
MPPKEPAPKKAAPVVARQAISTSSLVYVPEDIVEGFEQRIETGIDWTLIARALRGHKALCKRDTIRKVTFSEALENKINRSIINGFLDKESGLTLDQHWEFLLPAILWDNEKFANEEEKICFRNDNCITDDLVPMIKKTVKSGHRNTLKEDMKMVCVLRVNDSEMSELDESLAEYKKLVTLNLCGNFLSELMPDIIPPSVKNLELQTNFFSDLSTFAEALPTDLLYLGLAKNFLTSDNVDGIGLLPFNLTVLDLSDNDIYHLDTVLEAVARLPNLSGLQLSGNPCSGVFGNFHVELEIPLLDAARRRFLMFRNHESLIEMLPPDEEDAWHTMPSVPVMSKLHPSVEEEASSHSSDIYTKLEVINPREIRNFTTFETNKVQWNKVMNFQEPVLKIFCPDLTTLRDTFRTIITIRLVYTVTHTAQKASKKSHTALHTPLDMRVILATIKCTLNSPDWSQHGQHFHWDDSLGTQDAIHWGDGDLSVLQYSNVEKTPKTPKGKSDDVGTSSRQVIPDNLTCHFGFGIDTLKL